MIYMKKFGSRLKSLRTSFKLTQKSLAEKLKVGESTIGMWERDEREPSFEFVRKLADFFNVTTDYLLGRSDDPNKTESQEKREVDQEQLKLFSQRLREGLKEAGVSVEEAANACGVSEEYIQKLMDSPAKLPGAKTLLELANMIGVTSDYLGGFTPDPNGFHPDTPKPKDLKSILEDQDIMFDGTPLTEDDRDMVLRVINSLNFEAKRMNKRKK